MARELGNIEFPTNLEVLKKAPLDARTRVETVSDLTSIPYAYKQMVVAVYDDDDNPNGLYILQGDDSTNSDHWLPLSAQGPTGEDGKSSTSGYIFYSEASDNAPTFNTVGIDTTYNFSTGIFTALPNENGVGWFQTPPTLSPGSSSKNYWHIPYSVIETEAGADPKVGTPTFGEAKEQISFSGLVTFSGDNNDTITNINGVSLNITAIDGGKITTGEIKSHGYAEGSNNTFSDTGTKIVLDGNDAGTIKSENFSIDDEGNAHFKGNLSGSDITGATGTFSGTLSVGSSVYGIGELLNSNVTTIGAAEMGLLDFVNITTASIQEGTTATNVGLGNVQNVDTASIQAGTTAANVGLGDYENTNPQGILDSALTASKELSSTLANFPLNSAIPDNATPNNALKYVFNSSRTGTAQIKLDIRDAEAMGTFPDYRGIQASCNGLKFKTRLSGLGIFEDAVDRIEDNGGTAITPSHRNAYSLPTTSYTEDVHVYSGSNTIRVWSDTGDGGTLKNIEVLYTQNKDRTSGTLAGWKMSKYNINSGPLANLNKNIYGYNRASGGMILNYQGSLHSPNFYIDKDGSAGFRGTVTIGDTDLDPANTFNIDDPSSAGSLLYNPNFLKIAPDGRPAGVKSIYGSSVTESISYEGAPDQGVLKISSESDKKSAASFSAFKVSAGTKYRFTIKTKHTLNVTKGMYFRMLELDSEIGEGITHLTPPGNGFNGESGIQNADRLTTSITNGIQYTNNKKDGEVIPDLENLGVTTGYRIFEFTYEPTSTAVYISPMIMNWFGSGNANDYAGNGDMFIDRIYASPLNNSEDNSSGGTLFPNPEFTRVAEDGRPYGVKAVFGSDNLKTISYNSDKKLKIGGQPAGEKKAGASFLPFRINKGAKYKFYIRLKSEIVDSTGIYIRMLELDNELEGTNTHITGRDKTTDPDAENEANTQLGREIKTSNTNTSQGKILDIHINGTLQTSQNLENLGKTADYRLIEFVYEPTSTTKLAALQLLNWNGTKNSDSNGLIVDKIYAVPTTEDIYRGTVAGWKISKHNIASGNTENNSPTLSGYLGNDGIVMNSNGSLHSKNFYIDSNGDAGFRGDLEIEGVGPSLDYNFSGSLDSNLFYSSITTTVSYDSPTFGNEFNNNNSSWDEGFRTKATFDRKDGGVFEWDIVTSNSNPATRIGLFASSSSAPVASDKQKHTVYFQDRNIYIIENGQVGNQIKIASGAWVKDTPTLFRVSIQLKPTGAVYKIFKNGDFSVPYAIYDSQDQNVSTRYLNPGASIYSNNPGNNLLFSKMSAGKSLGQSTKISGNTIQTGKILSNNHSGTSNGSAMSTTGMAIDLDNGAISSKNFRIASNGDSEFSGTMKIGNNPLTKENTFNSDNTSGGSVISNTTFQVAAADGRPAGVKSSHKEEASKDRIKYSSDGQLEISGHPAAGACFPAFKINQGTKYNISVRLSQEVNASSGLYMRMQELDEELPSGKTHISMAAATTTEEGVVQPTRQRITHQDMKIDGVGVSSLDNVAVKQASRDIEFTYVPTSTAKYVSLNILNWSGAGDTAMYIERVSATPTVDTPILLQITDNTSIPTETTVTNGLEYTFQSKTAGTAQLKLLIKDAEASGTYPNYAGVQASVNGNPLKTRLSRSDVGGANNTVNTFFDTVLVESGNNTLKVWSNTDDSGKLIEAEIIYTQTDDKKTGTVGGWTIAPDAIYSGNRDTNGYKSDGGVTLAAAGSIHSKDFYIDTQGNAKFKGDLEIEGVGPSLDYNFSGSLDSNLFYSNITTTISYDSPVFGNEFNNNNNSWDEGFRTKATFDRKDGGVFEWDIVTSEAHPATKIGLFASSSSAPVAPNYQKHTVYFQGRNIYIIENGNSGNQIKIASGAWVEGTPTLFRVSIQLKPTGAVYKIFKNGDFSVPYAVYDSQDQNISTRFLNPGVSIHSNNPDNNLLFNRMSAGKSLGQSTKISGNTIQTGKILSNNHSGISDGSAVSTTGMAIDLDNGSISTPNFRVSSSGDLQIVGMGPSLDYNFSGSLDSNLFENNIGTQRSHESPTYGNSFNTDYTKNGQWGQGFRTKAVYDRENGGTFEWDVIANLSPTTMLGLYDTDESYSFSKMAHAFYFAGTSFIIYEKGVNLYEANGSKNGVTDSTARMFSARVEGTPTLFRVSIQVKPKGAIYRVFKDGDFSEPFFTYDSTNPNAVPFSITSRSPRTDRYLKPGVAIHLNTTNYSNNYIIFNRMSAGKSLGQSTKISGNTIKTGKILSNNHSGTSDGSAVSTTGMAIDLDNGAISTPNFRVSSSGDLQIVGVDPLVTYQFEGGSLSEDIFENNLSSIEGVSLTVGNHAYNGVKIFNESNSDWSQGFRTKRSFDRKLGGVFEWDIVLGDRSNRAMFGLYNDDETSYSHSVMSHAVQVVNAKIEIYELNNRVMDSVTAWADDDDFSLNQQFRIRIQLLEKGAKYEIFKNGDFTTPFIQFNSSESNGDHRFLKPGVSVSKGNTGFILQSMAAGARLGMSTKISGNTIQTGKILSNNHEGNDNGELMTDRGMAINLDNGSISSQNFRISEEGSAFFAGTVSGSQIIGGTLEGGSLSIPANAENGTPNFSVDSEGNMTAVNAIISGSINADTGKIGNWEVINGALRDTSARILLDPSQKGIILRNTDGELKAKMTADTSLSPAGTSKQFYRSDRYAISSAFDFTGYTNSSRAFKTTSKYSGNSPSNSFTKTGFYTVDKDVLGLIRSYSTTLIDQIKSDIPTGKNIVPTYYNDVASYLNNLGGSDEALKAPESSYRGEVELETVIEMLYNGAVYQRETINNVVIEGPKNLSYWSLIKSGTNAGDWERITNIEDAAVVSGQKRDLTTDPLIFNINSTSASYKFRIVLNLKVRSAREITYTINNNNYAVRSSSTKTTRITTSGDHSPIQFYSIDLLLPSNFSEISGGGVQVVTNNDQYVQIPRNAPGAAETTKILETKGGIVNLDNSTQVALSVTGSIDVRGNIDATDRSIHFKYLNSYSNSGIKKLPLPYLYKGSYTFTPPNKSADTLYTVSFSNPGDVGTANYYVLGNLRGGSETSWNSRNDCIVTIFSKTSSSFKFAVREVSNNTGGYIYFEYVLVYPY